MKTYYETLLGGYYTMKSTAAIEKLMSIKHDLETGEKFEGRQRVLRAIDKKIAFLLKYNPSDNLPRLFVKETISWLGKDQKQRKLF